MSSRTAVRARKASSTTSDRKASSGDSDPRRKSRKSSAGFGLNDSDSEKKVRKPAPTSVVDTLLRLAVGCLFLLSAALLAISFKQTPPDIVFMSDGERQAGLLQTVSASTNDNDDERRVRVPNSIAITRVADCSSLLGIPHQ